MIIGLGPAGASPARAAAGTGCRVLAIDRKVKAGEPVQCAEFVPTMLSPVIEAVSAVRCQRIDEMQTFVEDETPDRKDDFPGVMVDRTKFDQYLVDKAIDAGAACRFNTTVAEITPDGSVLLGNGEHLEAQIVIGADGPRSRVSRAIGTGNTEVVVARQITVPLQTIHLATDIFLSTDYRGGYAWLFPRGDVANLGLGVVPEARNRLKEMLAQLHESLVAEGRVAREIVSTTGGTIPVGGMLNPRSMLGERLVLLCGDAAGLTNPITGAGISSAVLSGTLAGECAADWLDGNEAAASEYSDEMGDLFGAALSRAVVRREAILSRYKDRDGPSRRDLRKAWIAYPKYWAA